MQHRTKNRLKKYIAGIDPGINGGLALKSTKGDKLLLEKLPQKPKDLFERLDSFAIFVFIEANRMARSSDKPIKGLPTFCENYGKLLAAIEIADLPYLIIEPSTWQAFHGLNFKPPKLIKDMTSKEEGTWYTERKRRHLAFAKELYPDQKLYGYHADALLIADFGHALYTKNNGT